MTLGSYLYRLIYFQYLKSYSFLFCLRHLPWYQAKKIPILISPKVRLGVIRERGIRIVGPISPYMIQIGMKNGSEGFPHGNTYISVHPGGLLEFNGKAVISEGTCIRVDKEKLTIGSDFYCNNNCFLRVTRNIVIGNDVMFGWNIILNTSNGHPVYRNGVERPMESPITIGNHVWIASDTSVCKGVTIADGCLVLQKSLLNGHYDIPHSLIAGNPARIITSDYVWRRE